MTRSQLIEALARAEGITLNAAGVAVDLVVDSIARALAHGNRVEIRGLGSFKVKNYDGYDGRNPRSGEKIEVKPKKLPFFKVGKEMKTRLNGEDDGAVSSD
jgi:integration host factor subunit beta